MNRKFLIIAFVLSNLALLAQVKAVDPSDTFYGGNAGNNTTTGNGDSAFGWYALNRVTTGNFNTAIGVSALERNTTGNQNQPSVSMRSPIIPPATTI